MNKSYAIKGAFMWQHRMLFLEAVAKLAPEVLVSLADIPATCYRALPKRQDGTGDFDAKLAYLFDDFLADKMISDEEIVEIHSSRLISDSTPIYQEERKGNTIIQTLVGRDPVKNPEVLMSQMLKCLRDWAKSYNLNANWVLAVAIRTLARIHFGTTNPTRFFYLPTQYFLLEFLPKHLENPSSFSIPGWQVFLQTDSEYKNHLKKSFQKFLDSYCNEVAEFVESMMENGNGIMINAPKREQGHFKWLVRWQIQGKTKPEIAKEFKTNDETVKKALIRTAEMIGLQLLTK